MLYIPHRLTAALSSNMVCQPPEDLVNKFRVAWRADFPQTKGVANPNPCPRSPFPFPQTKACTPEPRSLNLHSINPFKKKFADSNSSITIAQMVILKLPVKDGYFVIQDVAFSKQILGTILSVGQLCRAGIVWFFTELSLSLLVSGCAPSPYLIEMNPISQPTSMVFSTRNWHVRLGHASDKVVLSVLCQHVPTFDTKLWRPFFCEVCAKAKSTHCQYQARVEIANTKPLDLLLSDRMEAFTDDPIGCLFILTVRDHALMYSFVYPLKLRSKAPDAILETINLLRVQLKITPKAVQTDNGREFTSANFTGALRKMGLLFTCLLPYSPQEIGEDE
ncbi:hypothetical protein O181_112181 [Austropuccinia psidii MF-1]|uniref:Integrase catalytic domain-containing protein n=1 Tax=Austropuccinia psidii MF-1 TaxID=1389203 RepID=A0A9Q3PTB9_9BASI|nr:hypothetical protein [Austropuccinia psidii MF-1]